MMQPLPIDGYNPVKLYHVLYTCLLLNSLIYSLGAVPTDYLALKYE